MATDQKDPTASIFEEIHDSYWFFFLPNAIPLLELTITRFPNALDLTLPLAITAPPYFIAGLVDYSFVVAAAQTVGIFVTHTSINVTACLLLCACALRLWRFGLGAFCRRWVEVDWMDWSEVRRLNHLMLLLSPALFWAAALEIVGAMGAIAGPERFRSFLSTFVWFFVTGKIGEYDLSNTSTAVLKMLPTLVLSVIAVLPAVLTTIARTIRRFYMQIPIRDWWVWSELIKADAFAARMRDESLRRTLAALRTLPSAVLSRLPREQRQPLTSSVGAKKIRLLRLLPAIKGFYEIRGNLEEVELPDASDSLGAICAYTAVSYCWGDPTPTRSIFVDDKQIQVSESAYQVLRGLRPLWRCKRFWIDQICIKQDDIKDKEDQIPLMARIYQKSSRLIIWLGDAHDDGPVAAATVNRLWVWNRLARIIGWDLSASLPSATAKQALLGLVRNPWFMRTWVVQEVSKGSNISWTDDATIVYGGAHISWKRFAFFAMTVLRQHDLVADLTNGNEEEASICLLVSQHVTTMVLLSWLYTKVSLLFCLVRMFRVGSFDASINKDRIYGLLSLCHEDAKNQTLIPDYAKPDVEFLTEVARHLLDTASPGRELEFIGHAGLAYGSKIPGLPSWVPDWTAKPVAAMPCIELAGTADLVTPGFDIAWNIAHLHSDGEFSSTHVNQRPRFRAARHVLNAKFAALAAVLNKGSPSFTDTSDVQILAGNKLLSVSALCIGRIHSLGCAMRSSSGLNTDLDSYPIDTAIMHWLFLARSNLPNAAYGDNDTVFPPSFLRTICGDLSFDWTDVVDMQMPERPLTDTSLAALRWYVRHEVETLYPGYDDLLESTPQTELLERLKRVILLACGGRMFGITGQGCYGLFLRGSKLGDLIFLLEGSPVPLCLRPSDGEDGMEGTFKVVGPCYIQGLYGESLGSEGMQRLVLS